MRRLEPGRRYITVQISDTLVAWLAEYAKERNVGREHIVETALTQLKERVDRVG